MKRIGILATALGLVAIAASPAERPHISRVHRIEISGMGFRPESLTVARGDTVVWINRDIVPHTSAALRKSGWDSGTLLQGQEYRVVLERAGREEYRCALHPTMTGTLIVR